MSAGNFTRGPVSEPFMLDRALISSKSLWGSLLLMYRPYFVKNRRRKLRVLRWVQIKLIASSYLAVFSHTAFWASAAACLAAHSASTDNDQATDILKDFGNTFSFLE